MILQFLLLYGVDHRFISAGPRSLKNIGYSFFVVLWITYATWRTVYPFPSMVFPMSTVGVDGCTFRMTIRKALLLVVGMCGIAPHSLLVSGWWSGLVVYIFKSLVEGLKKKVL